MLPTRTRPAGAALLAACLLLSGTGRSDQKEKAPPQPPPADPAQARKDFEASLAGRPPAEVLAFVEALAKDRPAHKGAVDVAHARLTARAAAAAQARQRLDDLKPPAPAPLALQVDDATVKAEQARADFLAARVRDLEAVRTALGAVGAAGAEFDRAAAAADEHLFRLRAAAAATKAGPGELPEGADAAQLDGAAAELTGRAQEAKAVTEKAKAGLGPVEKDLTDARAASAAAVTSLEGLKGALADAAEGRKFEAQARAMTPAQLGDESAKLRKVLAEKTAAAEGDRRDAAAATAAAAEARTALNAVADPLPPTDGGPFEPTETPEGATAKLTAVQLRLAAWIRAGGEREEKVKALTGALDELEKKAVAHATTLGDARRVAGQLTAIAAEAGRRVGGGDLDPARAPDAEPGPDRGALDRDARAVALVLARVRQERAAVNKPDPGAENIKALTAQLLARVNERLALLGELKKFAADHAAAWKDRPEAEQKRLEQLAAERLDREAGEWDWALGLDRSPPAAAAAGLLAADYRELVEWDERAESLKRQQEALAALAELTRREAADAAKLLALLDKGDPASPGGRTRSLWDEWLRARLGPIGLAAEAGAYQGGAARLAAVTGTNARRVAALTGNPAPEPGRAAEQTKVAAGGGEIGRARAELRAARARGLRTTGIKIGAILLAGLLVPPVLMFVLRRAIRGGTDAAGNPSPVLGALRGVLKAATRVAAVALVLSTLGYDVTALVIALAIGALAVALAARPMIADVLGSVVIFAERRFKVGDVVRLGGGEAARVAEITWRSTALKAPNGLVISVPNRKVTEASVENLSKGTETYDALAVTVSTDKDAGKVINVIRTAVSQCKNVSPDNGVTVVRYTQKGSVKVVEYRFWWFLKDYETRNKTRDEVFARIALGLAHEDMSGIEVTLG